MLGDDLMNDCEQTHASTIAVMKVPHKEVSNYGVIVPDGKVNDSLYNVKNFVEKPAIDKAPSALAIAIC